MFPLKIVSLVTSMLLSSLCWAQFKIEIIDASSKIDFQKDQEAKKQYQQLMALVGKIERALPQQLKSALNQTIQFEFTDSLYGKKTLSAHQIAGRVKGRHKVELNPDILFSGTTNGRHDLVYTMIHEIGHLYDNLNFHNGSDKNQIAYCQSQNTISMIGDGNISSDCIAYRQTRTSISTKPAYLNLYGANLESYDGKRSKVASRAKNDKENYEELSPKESFASKFEDFIMDPEFKCKQPSFYRLLEQELNHVPFPNKSCEDSLVYIDSGSLNIEKILNQTEKSTSLKKIDFSRVYQIHYLLAAEGQEMMSRWGHSMLRLVICAPGKALGPDCVKDLSHHLILSFRGLVNTTQIDSYAGLTGQYPSRLYLQDVIQVAGEYTRQELRDVVSYPLKLNREQMKSIIERAIEIFWTYNGQYYFLHNNCAHETFNLVRSALNDPKLNAEVVSTPIGLLDVFKKNNLVDDSVFANSREILKRDGYLFENQGNFLSEALDLIRSINPSPLLQLKSVDEYLKTSADFRKDYFISSLTNIEKSESFKSLRNKTIGQFVLLEDYIWEKSSKEIAIKIGKDLSDAKKVATNSNLQKIYEISRKKIENVVRASNPGAIVKENNYGIPSFSQTQVADQDLKQIVLEDKKLNEELLKLFESVKTNEDKVMLESIESNIKLMKSKLDPLLPLVPRSQQ